jgi:FkbM family methyltransferase
LSQLIRALTAFRSARSAVPILGTFQRWVRPLWYLTLGALYPRGAPTTLGGMQNVRLHPRLLSMRPEQYEPEVSTLLRRLAHRGATVVDIGAHVGLHTLLFSESVGTTGRVIAIEASPATATVLRSHIAWNQLTNIEVVQAAMGDREGAIDFTFRSDPLDLGGFANSLAYDIGGVTQSIPMTTLDKVCADLTPDLIKIDVEGAELHVLRGGAETLKRAHPTLVVAIHPEPMQMMGTTPSELVMFLEALGYSGHHLDGRVAKDPKFEEILFRPSRSN